MEYLMNTATEIQNAVSMILSVLQTNTTMSGRLINKLDEDIRTRHAEAFSVTRVIPFKTVAEMDRVLGDGEDADRRIGAIVDFAVGMSLGQPSRKMSVKMVRTLLDKKLRMTLMWNKKTNKEMVMSDFLPDKFTVILLQVS